MICRTEFTYKLFLLHFSADDSPTGTSLLHSTTEPKARPINAFKLSSHHFDACDLKHERIIMCIYVLPEFWNIMEEELDPKNLAINKLPTVIFVFN